MIKSLTIENIKSIKAKLHIDFKDFNLFIGENGSGKSTILQVIALLKQNYSQQKLAEGNLVRLGNYQKIAGDSKAPIRITVTGNIKPEDVEPFSYLIDLDYELSIVYKDDHVETLSLTLKANRINEILKSKFGIRTNAIFHTLRNAGDNPSSDNNSFFYHTPSNLVIQPVAFAISNSMPLVISPEIFMYASSANASRDAMRDIQKAIRAINAELRKDLTERVSIIPALRGIDTSEYPLLQKGSDEFVNAYNFRNQAELLVSSLEFRREYADRISEAIEAVVGRKTRTRLVDGPKVLVEVYNGEKWVNIMNEGFGVNPLIHLIFQTVVAPRSSLILIEEPEIHLYPAAQKRLAEQLVRIAQEDDKHLVITSHSENILLSMIHQSRQTNMKEKVQICYFARDPNKRTSEMVIVNDANMGKLFKDFFATNLHEIANLQELQGL